MAKRATPEEVGEVPEFNQKALSAWKPGPTTRTFSDPKTPGLVLRVTSKGAKTYFYTYRMGGRGTKFQWLKVGDFSATPLVRAQELARGYRTQRDQGIDPAKALEAAAHRGATVEDACKRFLLEYAPKNLSPKSQKDYADSIRVHIVPGLGQIPIRDLTRDQVASWHAGLVGKGGRGSVAANRALAVLSSVCTQAEIWGLRDEGANPCRHVDRFEEAPRVRDIQPEELRAVGEALRALDGTCTPWALAAVRVCALCAGRVSEVLGLRRDRDVHLRRGYALVRKHKTSRKTGAKHLELPPAAVTLLQALPEVAGNPYYFPGRAKGMPMSRHGLHKTWLLVCEKAGVVGLHLHDFRSFAASEALAQGLSDKAASQVLGHADVRTTQRHYAKVRQAAATEASAKVSAPVAQAFGLAPETEAAAQRRRLVRRAIQRLKP